jgi:hypothetical protein
MVRVYDTLKALEPNYCIMDVRKRGVLDFPGRLWMLQDYYPKVLKLGLKKLDVIYDVDPDETTKTYYEKNFGVFDKYGIEIRFTKDPGELLDWVNEPRSV